MATAKQIQDFQRETEAMNGGIGGTKQTYTGVANGAGGMKKGLSKQKIMLEPGVYQVRTAKLIVAYNGYDETKEVEHQFKVSMTVPEKWLDNDTPVSTLKEFFLKAYRKKHPKAPLALLPDEKVSMVVKDESMFVFSKQAVKDDEVIRKVFWDRQNIFAYGPDDWDAQAAELKKYRKIIVTSLTHTHRNVRHEPSSVHPVVSAKQLVPTNTYVVFTGWHKMQCVIVKPEHTIADLKAYLHEKNGARMPLECIDIGVRSGDDIRIIDDALTVQNVYDRMQQAEPDFGTGPGTLVDMMDGEGNVKEDAVEHVDDATQRAIDEIAENMAGRGPGAKYFRKHDTTSRIHADWDHEDADRVTYGVDDAPHTKGLDVGETIGPQMPMHLRKTHAPAPGKYDHLVAPGFHIGREGEVVEEPRIKTEAERKEGLVEDVTDVTDQTPAAEGAQTLVGLEPEPKDISDPEPKPETRLTAPSVMGKTLVLGVGKRIQDVKHKIWVASCHDPYSFRGPEDRQAKGGAADSYDL